MTFCGIISASGNTIPPAFIFPRVRYKDVFLTGAPSDSLGLGSKSGWMTEDLFLEVLKHVKMHSRCSVEAPILLLMDNHVSHTSLSSIVYAKTHGIVLLSFPPHCTHRMQPLDVGVYGPFKSYLKKAFNNFMLMHPGKPISIYDIPKLANEAFKSSFNIQNIKSAFEKCGIWPVNDLVYTEEVFAATYVTDRPSSHEGEIVEIIPDSAMLSTENVSSQIDSPIAEIEQNTQESSVENVYPNTLSPVVSPTTSQNMLENIRPFPKAQPKKQRNTKRKVVKSRVYTDSPEKDQGADLIINKKKISN